MAASSERVASPGHGREEGSDRRGPLAREREIARERGECGLTGGVEPTAGERRERGGAADRWGRPISRDRREGRGRGRGAREGVGPETAQPRREKGFSFFFSIFYFSFLFSISISFISFSLEQIIS